MAIRITPHFQLDVFHKKYLKYNETKRFFLFKYKTAVDKILFNTREVQYIRVTCLIINELELRPYYLQTSHANPVMMLLSHKLSKVLFLNN